MARWGGSWTGNDWTARLWAPDAGGVTLILDGQAVPMQRGDDGFWSATARPQQGARYLFRVNGHDIPDPASRLQGGDVHSPSVVTRPRAAAPGWRGRDWAEAVVCELHLGTFTPEGTLAAARDRLAGLADLGITAIELMPLGQFPGTRGWGYDGVLPFALHPAYGRPDDLAAFVDHAHGLGLMVILDLVMNHFGPEGAYLHLGAPRFFDPGRHTPWGAAIDFSQGAVRDFWCECGEYWVGEFGLDGLRLDAVHQITGPGAEDFLRQFARRVRAADPSRPIHLVLEDERNEPHLREAGFDAVWNDDFHHAVHVHLTGEDRGYYRSFADDPFGDLCLALERGHVEEGQPRPGPAGPRGRPGGHLPPTAFVNAIQTHDQIGNRPLGERLLTLADPAGVRTAFALLLVAPFIPLIFMGEERGAAAPFLFFADFSGDLAQAIRSGREREFAALIGPGDTLPDPLSLDSFQRSQPDWSDTDQARSWLDLTRRALRFRAGHVVPLLKSGIAGPARVVRTGSASLAAEWSFRAGRLDLRLSLGHSEPDLAALPDPAFVLGRPGQDPYALSAGTSAP